MIGATVYPEFVSIVDAVRFGNDGLIPAIVQDAVSGDVLMLAFMNHEALRLTASTGETHFWSRSRQRIWRKGETSGHTQTVEEIRVNCEQNSLLLRVRQRGAVCHEGYETCFYRRVADDGSLTIVRERAFDPDTVYGSEGQDPGEDEALAAATRRQFGAYAYLRDHDLTSESGTSRRLRAGDEGIDVRIAEELRELAGVLAGEHRHGDRLDDLRLEASQVIYWVLLQALGEGITWSELRPDHALARESASLATSDTVARLRADAEHWGVGRPKDADIGAAARATLQLVGLACRSGGVDPIEVVVSDTEALQARPYLAAYFANDEGRDEYEPEQRGTATP